jgi:glycosyltransferase involved in cell wall biosynthesis
MLAYNHERFIAQAVESVLMQNTSWDYELVIAEDCSTDRTRDIVMGFKKQYPDKITLLLQDQNVGPSRNNFDLLSNLKGRYVAALEGDDYWTLSEKLDMQVSLLENNPDVGLIYTDIEVVDELDQLTAQNWLKEHRKRYLSGEIFFDLLDGNFINTPTACFRRDLMNAGLKRIAGNAQWINDSWLWLTIAMRGKTAYIDKVTARYRKHEKNLSQTGYLKDSSRKYHLYKNILEDFDELNKKELTRSQKAVISGNSLSLVYNKNGRLRDRWKFFMIFIKYFPGIKLFLGFLKHKISKVL